MNVRVGMKKLMFVVVAALLVLSAVSGSVLADTYTWQSRDSGGDRTDFEDLDHSKAYLWAFNWKPDADELITGATLQFNSIYNHDNYSNWLGVYLISNKPSTGGTTGWSAWSTDVFGTSDLTPDTAVFQKSDSENVAKPFDTVANKVLVGAYSDTRPGSTTKDSPIFDFAHPALISSVTPTWGWNIYDDIALQASALDEFIAWSADGNWALGIDPDCHFYNCGVTLKVTTRRIPTHNEVPEPMSMILGALGLGLVTGWKRRRRA